jgi:membrane protease YdiL (CAAX protease family)
MLVPTAAADRRESLALLFAAAFPSIGTFLYFVVLSGSRWAAPVYLGCKVVQFSFPLLWIVGVERGRLHFFRRPGTTGLWIGLASGLGMVALLSAARRSLLALPELAGVPAAIAGKLAGFGIATPGRYLVVAIFYALLHSLLEEYYWRWFLFGRLRRRLPAAAAVVLSSLAFTAHHVLVLGQLLGGYGPLTWLGSLCVTAAGALWAWSYHRSNSLYGPWLSHGLVDAGLMGVGYQIWRLVGGG